MKYIPITEAMKRLGKSDRQVRRMVHSGKLTYQYAPDRKLEILASDIDKVIRQTRPPQEVERLDALEREIAALRQEVDDLSRRVEALSPAKKQSPQKSIVGPIEQGEVLPPHLIPIFDLIKQYNLTRQRQAIMRHMQPWIREGRWRRAGHAVEKALDPEGIAEFRRRYGPGS